MTRAFRFATGALAIATWFAAPAIAQRADPGQDGDRDAHHHNMMVHGTEAMGFDQDRTTHHFLLYEDGGAIDVSVNEATDHVNLHAVRQHLQEIVVLFKTGDFGKPMVTHSQQVPGSADMTRLKDRLTYRYQETSKGGRVRIVTSDPEALAAVHMFLHFQIEDHRTGDSGTIERESR